MALQINVLFTIAEFLLCTTGSICDVFNNKKLRKVFALFVSALSSALSRKRNMA